MFRDISIVDNDGDTKFTFSEWVEVGGLLEISISEFEVDKYKELFTMSVLSKDVWEEFKRAGDVAFSMMEGV